MSGRFKKLIYISFFVVIIVVPMVSWGVLSALSVKNPTIMETLDFDLDEKRLKATISEPIDLAVITEELEKYYDDRIPYRSILITTKKAIDAKIEEPYKNGLEMTLLKLLSKKRSVEVATLYEDSYDGRAYRCFDQAVDLYFNHALAKDEIDPYDATIEYPLKITDNGRVIIGQSNWLYLYLSNYDYYNGIKSLATTSEIKARSDKYEELNDLCKKLGKKLVIYICPEKEEIYPEYMPTVNIVDDKELPLYIKDYVDSHTDVAYIYPKEEFLKYKKNYILYKKYDSHWNYVGGYLAINKIKEALGLETTPLYDMDLEKYDYTYGDLIPYGNISVDGLTRSVEYNFKNYKEDYNVDEKVIVENFQARAFETTSDKGADETAFIVGDSYVEAVIPFARKEFGKLYCTSFLNLAKDFVRKQVEDADDIVLIFVERNENVALKEAVNIITRILKNYEKNYKKPTD